MTIVGLRCQWQEFPIKFMVLLENNVYSTQKARNSSLFLRFWMEFQLYLSGHPELEFTNTSLCQLSWLGRIRQDTLIREYGVVE